MSLPWFRMYASFMGDPVVQSLAFEDQRHYVIALCLKCDGVLDRKVTKSVRERLVARALGLDPPAAAEAKRRLMEVRLVTEDWQPRAWSRRQYKSDNSTERVRKYRKTKETGNVSVTFQKRFGNGPDTDTDPETEIPPISPPAGDAAPKVPPCPFEKIRERYNEAAVALSKVEGAVGMPRCTGLPDTLKRAIRARWTSDQVGCQWDHMNNFFAYVEAQPFLGGKNSKGWRASLEWLMRPSNFQKVIDEHYREETRRRPENGTGGTWLTS